MYPLHIKVNPFFKTLFDPDEAKLPKHMIHCRANERNLLYDITDIWDVYSFLKVARGRELMVQVISTNKTALSVILGFHTSECQVKQIFHGIPTHPFPFSRSDELYDMEQSLFSLSQSYIH